MEVLNEYARESARADAQINQLIDALGAWGDAKKLDVIESHLDQIIEAEEVRPVRAELLKMTMQTRVFAARVGWETPSSRKRPGEIKP